MQLEFENIAGEGRAASGCYAAVASLGDNILYALSLTQPWATLAVLALKEWETRSWSTRFRGNVYIHAAKNFPKWARECLNYPVFKDALAPFGYTSSTQFPIGQIIGKVEIVGCEPTRNVEPRISQRERAFGDYSDGRFAFEMRSPKHFRKYIDCRGALGFWKVPQEVLASIREAA